jgi:hypothetical protein
MTAIEDKAMESKSINVYELIPSEKIVKHEKLIAELLFGMKSSDENNKHFYISHLTACIFYSDNNALGKNTNRESILKDPRYAENSALKFMQDKNRVLARNGIPPLFPKAPHTIDVVVAGLDHFLCRFTVYLPLGINKITSSMAGSMSREEETEGSIVAEEPAPIYGTAVEIRVSTTGEIIGVKSYWRPCYELAKIVSRIAAPFSHGHATAQVRMESSSSSEDADSHVSNKSDKAPLCYLLEGDEQPQRFLAPYYIFFEEGSHDSSFIPASQYSLVIAILEERTLDGVILTPKVLKGKLDDGAAIENSIECEWATLKLDGGFEELGSKSRLKNHGHLKKLTLGNGSFNVFLQVRDRLTGAVAVTQKLIYGDIRANLER